MVLAKQAKLDKTPCGRSELARKKRMHVETRLRLCRPRAVGNGREEEYRKEERINK